MNVDTGEIARMHAGQAAFAKLVVGSMQQLPKHLSPFAEAHMAEHPDEPVDLKGESALANYASEQRAKRTANPGSFGRCKNRPQ